MKRITKENLVVGGMIKTDLAVELLEILKTEFPINEDTGKRASHWRRTADKNRLVAVIRESSLLTEGKPIEPGKIIKTYYPTLNNIYYIQ